MESSRKKLQKLRPSLRRCKKKLQLWTALDSFGQLWTALDSFGQLWTALDSFGQLWTALDSFGQLWTALDSFGQLWTALFIDSHWSGEQNVDMILAEMLLRVPVRLWRDIILELNEGVNWLVLTYFDISTGLDFVFHKTTDCRPWIMWNCSNAAKNEM